MTKEEAIDILVNATFSDGWQGNEELTTAYHMAIKALEQDSIAQERYEDLCEYFGGSEAILKSRDDFKAWLDRVKWHVCKAEELYEKYEREPILDKIRAEIEQLPTKTRINWDGCLPDIDYPEIEYVDVTKNKLLSIINKYTTESEEQGETEWT